MAWLLRQTEVALCVGGTINRLLWCLLTHSCYGYWLLAGATICCLMSTVYCFMSIVFCLLHIIYLYSYCKGVVANNWLLTIGSSSVYLPVASPNWLLYLGEVMGYLRESGGPEVRLGIEAAPEGLREVLRVHRLLRLLEAGLLLRLLECSLLLPEVLLEVELLLLLRWLGSKLLLGLLWLLWLKILELLLLRLELLASRLLLLSRCLCRPELAKGIPELGRVEECIDSIYERLEEGS